MGRKLTRRDLLGIAGATGLTALGARGRARAADTGAPPAGSAAGAGGGDPAHPPARLEGGKVVQPRRELPVLHTTDVLVVGGGPAGVAAAIAASRVGAKTTLVERYGHLGGLWTGGLVLIVVGMNVAGGKQVTKGIGEEMLTRLEKLDRGIVNHRPGASPTVDAEALKFMMAEMLREAGVTLFLHCWGVDAVMDGTVCKGAVFESKSGRQAILATQTVDASGDGDVYAAAGASFRHLKFRTGLVHRLGNLDKVDRSKTQGQKKPKGLGSITPVKGVNWVNMQGPAVDGLDVRELTRMEMNHRRHIWNSVQRLRQTPGYEQVYLVETAPQLGVRITRLLDGVHRLTWQDLQATRAFGDVVGVGGMWNARHPAWQIPYGALVPKTVDNVLAAGRCISGEARMADVLRVIPPCFVTGHAAGVAAAVAAQDGCRARHVAVAKVQQILKQQGAHLG